MRIGEQGAPLVGLGAGEREADRQPAEGAQQVQPQPPEVAGMGGAVAVFGDAGQVRAFHRSRERAHSTGVESASHTSSVHSLVSRAGALITHVIVAGDLRSRLL